MGLFSRRPAAPKVKHVAKTQKASDNLISDTMEKATRDFLKSMGKSKAEIDAYVKAQREGGR